MIVALSLETDTDTVMMLGDIPVPATVASSVQDPVWRCCACRHDAPDVGYMDLRGFAA